MITNVPDDLPNITPLPDDGEPSFEEMAASMPETAQGFLDAVLPPSVPTTGVGDAGGGDDDFLGDATDAPPRPRKRVDVTKKMRKAMNRLKGKVSNVPIMWFHTQAKEHPEWELDDDEKDLLKDAIDTVFEVLDIEVEIEPLSLVLTSIWWVVSYPVLAFLFLFLTKKSLTTDKDHEEIPS